MARLSKNKKRRIFTAIIVIILIVSTFIGAISICVNQLKSKYDMEMEKLNDTISSNQRMVYRALNDIPAGTEINSENTEYVSVFSDMDDYVYMTESGLGKIATADIFAGQNICTNMVGDDLAFSLRECEYALLTLSNNLTVNDLVDIRIMYPNGENYVVLTKKCIQSLDLENNAVMFWLSEDELMDMSSAIVDTYLQQGSILYTTKYIQDSQQELERTYQPSYDCMVAIQNDPNIVGIAKDALTERVSATLRSSLETRLDKFAGKDGQESSSSNMGANVDLSGSVRVGTYNGYTATDDASGGTTSADGAGSSESASGDSFSFEPETESDEATSPDNGDGPDTETESME